MLRHQLGDDAFWRSIKHYLEVNRGKNVVTPDLIKAIEETTHINVDRFFQQWIYSAGAPKFDLAYSYDAEKHQVALTVKQTQKVESNVGIFSAPVEVEITTATGPKLYTANVSKAAETFTYPSDSPPLMVLFDKGGYLLKSANFHKEKKEWLYQLQHATELSDRADATIALSKIKNDDEVVAALSASLNSDSFWGMRVLSAQALGKIGGPSALKHLLAALDTNKEPVIRNHIVTSLGNFKDNADLAPKLQSIAANDSSYRARAAALEALGRTKSADALPVLTAAVTSESPDDLLRIYALRSLGFLGNDKAVPLLTDWSKPGEPIDSRAPQSPASRASTNKTKISPNKSPAISMSPTSTFAGPCSTRSARAVTPAPSPRSKLSSNATTSASKWSPKSKTKSNTCNRRNKPRRKRPRKKMRKHQPKETTTHRRKAKAERAPQSPTAWIISKNSSNKCPSNLNPWNRACPRSPNRTNEKAMVALRATIANLLLNLKTRLSS